MLDYVYELKKDLDAELYQINIDEVETGSRLISKSCGDVSFEFIQNGYIIIRKYSERQRIREF